MGTLRGFWSHAIEKLGDENFFWICIWRIIGIVACVITISISSCCIHRDRLIADAIRNGSSPTAAAVAFSYNADARDIMILNAGKD